MGTLKQIEDALGFEPMKPSARVRVTKRNCRGSYAAPTWFGPKPEPPKAGSRVRAFVSGLPGADLGPPQGADERGLEMLLRIRAKAAAEAAALAPLVRRHYDTEADRWVGPDASDVEARNTAAATVALIDNILYDGLAC